MEDERNFDLSDFSTYTPHITADTPTKFGFVIHKSTTETASRKYVEKIIDN